MENEKTPAIVTHILGIFTFFVGPLVMYFAFKRKASPWLRDHLDEAVNYHILVLAAFILLIILAVVFTAFGLPTVSLLVAIVGLLIIALSVVFGVVAVVKAAKGQAYHFPLDIKIIK
jgi:hypothetical protein